MTRARFSRTALLNLLLSFNGKCAGCSVKIGPATGLDWDHVIPLAQGGDDALTNLQPLCKTCHRAKTSQDNPNTARAIRRQAAHLGIKAASRQALQSRGFPKAPPQRKASRPLAKQLPPRRISE